MSYSVNLVSISLAAAADLSASQYAFVKVNNAGKAALAGASDLNQIGVLQNKPTADQTAAIGISGVSMVKAGGTIAAGAQVTSNATGLAVASAAGKQPLGVALEGAASGDIIPVLLAKGGITPA